MTRKRTPTQGLLVSDVVDAMERIAPPHLAEEWDNCGLQVGGLGWPVRKVWVSLDPHPAVIQAAIDHQVDLLVTHHPLIFGPLHRIDVDVPVGGIVSAALNARMAIYAAHTSLDRARYGVNAELSRRVELSDVRPLVAAPATDPDSGLGRIGKLATPMPLDRFAEKLKVIFQSQWLKISGDPQMMIQRVALCSGSGSSLLDDFFASDAEVFVSGDLRYHDARTAEDMGRALIDLGHFASERIMIDAVAGQLQKQARSDHWTVTIEPCHMEQDPFRYI